MFIQHNKACQIQQIYSSRFLHEKKKKGFQINNLEQRNFFGAKSNHTEMPNRKEWRVSALGIRHLRIVHIVKTI